MVIYHTLVGRMNQAYKFVGMAIVFGTVGLLSLSLLAAPALAAPERRCGSVDTSLIECKESQDNADRVEDTPIWELLIIAINVLTAGIGVTAVVGIVYGSILWSSATGSPEQIKKARGIITNVVIGVLCYAVMYLVLNFIVPGGLLR